MLLESGMKAPAFALSDHEGNKIRLSAFRGKRVLLIFYLKDGSSACTRELLAFSQAADRFSEKGVSLVAVGREGVLSHSGFHEKYELKMPLLSDPEGRVFASYGALNASDAPRRAMFLIDGAGFVEKLSRKLSPDSAAAQALKWLEKI